MPAGTMPMDPCESAGVCATGVHGHARQCKRARCHGHAGAHALVQQAVAAQARDCRRRSFEALQAPLPAQVTVSTLSGATP